MKHITDIVRLFNCRCGTSALEFALVAPILIMLLFGIISYSVLMMTYSDVQQLTAESARASVSGLSNVERDQLARAFIANNLPAYPFLNPSKVSVTTGATNGAPPGFAVTITYDLSTSVSSTLTALVPTVGTTITRHAVVQQGGT